MPLANMLSITANPFLSMVIWIILLLAALYFARRPFHRVVGSISNIIYNAMRLSAVSVLTAEKQLVQRNREVLMAIGLEKTERMVEREFDRMNAAVIRDLGSYPNLHRYASELLMKLDHDYRSSANVLPSLPSWIPIIDSIAQIKHVGDSMVSNMLAEINRTLRDQHRTAVENYRNSSASRHAILSKMLPTWRKVQKTLNEISKAITNLNRRAKTIDRYMNEYEQVRSQSDKAVRMLSASSLTQFFIAALVLAIAFGGAIINFNLIALPLAEIVGAASYIGPYKTADVAGLMLILIALTMGLFLMELLRITRLFPILAGMDDRLRHRMIWITFGLLIVLAGLESALAFVRDPVAENLAALRQTGSVIESSFGATRIIPSIGQMLLGFILPFALAFVAIPLESFISSSRTVLGVVAAAALRFFAFTLRLIGNVGYYIGRLVVNLYDLVIFPAIWLESVIVGSKAKEKAAPGEGFYENGPIAEEAIDQSMDSSDFKKNQE